jgi:trehalose-6-phosphate synthase
MRRLRRVVRNADVYTWAQSFLTALQQPAEIVLP